MTYLQGLLANQNLQTTGNLLNAGGGISTTISQISAGNQAKGIGTIQSNQLYRNADLLDYSANETKGAAIQAAKIGLRNNKNVQSSIIAHNAAYGGSSTDKNVAELIADTAAAGEYNALSALYEGDSRATAIRNQAISDRNNAALSLYNGRQASSASRTNAITTLMGTAGKFAANNFNNGYGFYNKYGFDNN